jgi:recombination protein RecT
MNTRVETNQAKQHPFVAFKQQLEQRLESFKHALPAHVPAERFVRVVLTAVQHDPDLLASDRQSLLTACMRAAQDGLLPDGREGAIVLYKTKVVEQDGSVRYIRKAQWMPMVFGIIKKIRNSGQIAMITARVVYGGDTYRYWVDDTGEHLLYEPSETRDQNMVRLVFAAARTKDGELLVEPLMPEEIEKIRSASRARDDGPWVKWWEEMAKKSAIRRLSKRLPMSADLDDLIRRDDDLYDFDAREEVHRRRSNTLDAFVSEPAAITAANADGRNAPQPAQPARADHPQEIAEEAIIADLKSNTTIKDCTIWASAFAAKVAAGDLKIDQAAMARINAALIEHQASLSAAEQQPPNAAPDWEEDPATGIPRALVRAPAPAERARTTRAKS